VLSIALACGNARTRPFPYQAELRAKGQCSWEKADCPADADSGHCWALADAMARRVA